VLNDPLFVEAAATDDSMTIASKFSSSAATRRLKQKPVRRSIEISFANLATSTKPADIDGSLS
jgi:hypothetical protein